jgi:antitoxin ParD1/3/4
MSTVEKISVALPPEMVAIIRGAVDSGEYSSASEVVREALRGWKFKRKVEALELDELRQLVQEGIDSGPSIDADLVFARLKEATTSHGIILKKHFHFLANSNLTASELQRCLQHSPREKILLLAFGWLFMGTTSSFFGFKLIPFVLNELFMVRDDCKICSKKFSPGSSR